MKRGTSKSINVIFRVFFWLLIVLFLLGVIGFIGYFTNGFTGNFKTFYVRCVDRRFINEVNSCKLIQNIEYRFDVHYTLDFEQETDRDYSVKIIPNITDETDFEFKASNNHCLYSELEDISKGFELVKNESYFTLKITNDLDGILQAVFPDKNLMGVPPSIDSGKQYFAILVSSADYGQSVRINFSVETIKVIIDPPKVVF